MSKLFALLALAGLLTIQTAAAQLYDVRPGDVSYDKKPRPALKVQVDGKASDVRDYFQDWMKSSYNVKFKSGGLMGVGKNTVLMARQVPASTISGKLVDLYATVVAPTDSTAEVSVFGGYDDNTFFDPATSEKEFNALRGMVQNYAGAARTHAYRQMIEEAEKKLRESEKEKARLEKERQALAANTVANRQKIEELLKKNQENTLLSRSDSTLLIKNAAQRELDKQRLENRRARLSALERK
jgi:hypothetical protein